MKTEIRPHPAGRGSAAADGSSWIDLDRVARVTLTSEDPSHPIQDALLKPGARGWRAAAPGRQTLWIHFDPPQNIREIHLRFEAQEQRTQEIVLRWSADGGASYREVVRQQFNFSDSTRIEEENYRPQLTQVTELELTIIPDIAGGPAHASLQTLRLR